MKLAAMLAVLALLIGGRDVTLAADSPSWSIDALAKGIRARDQALKSFRFDAQLQIRTQSESTGQYLDYATATHVEVDRTTGRFFAQTVGQFHQPPSPMLGKKDDWFQFRDELIAFDGESTRARVMTPGLEIGTGEETRTIMVDGTVRPGPHPGWLIDPEEIAGRYVLKSVADRILGSPFQIKPSDQPNIVVLECEHTSTPENHSGRKRKSIYCIDVSKNMAVTRVEWSLQTGPLGGWTPYFKAMVEDWVEVDGFWMPHRYRKEERGGSTSGGVRLVSDMIATISNWSVNQEIPTNRFKIAFEPGTMVKDTDRGSTYRVGAITDAKIAEAARSATVLRSRFEEARATLDERPGPDVGLDPRWMAGLFIGLIFLGGGMAAWTLRRRGATRGRMTEDASS